MKTFIRIFLIPILSFGIITTLILFFVNRANHVGQIASIVLPITIAHLVWYIIIYFIIGRFVKKILFRIIWSIGIPLLMFGKIFKIMHWPGSTAFFYTGLIISLIATILFFVERSKKRG